MEVVLEEVSGLLAAAMGSSRGELGLPKDVSLALVMKEAVLVAV
jgi:hypothetical protein